MTSRCQGHAREVPAARGGGPLPGGGQPPSLSSSLSRPDVSHFPGHTTPESADSRSRDQDTAEGLRETAVQNTQERTRGLDPALLVRKRDWGRLRFPDEEGFAEGGRINRPWRGDTTEQGPGSKKEAAPGHDADKA